MKRVHITFEERVLPRHWTRIQNQNSGVEPHAKISILYYFLEFGLSFPLQNVNKIRFEKFGILTADIQEEDLERITKYDGVTSVDVEKARTF